MYLFKTTKPLLDHDMGDTVYIPENTDAYHEPTVYLKRDFLYMCQDNINKAQTLLDRLEWQHPETLLLEDEYFD